MMRDVVFEATKQGSLSLAAMALQWRCNGFAAVWAKDEDGIGHGDWPWRFAIKEIGHGDWGHSVCQPVTLLLRIVIVIILIMIMIYHYYDHHHDHCHHHHMIMIITKIYSCLTVTLPWPRSCCVLSWGACIYVCVLAHVCVRIGHVLLCVCTRARVHACVYVCTHGHAHVRGCMCVHMVVRVRARAHARVCAYVRVLVYMHSCLCVHTGVQARARFLLLGWLGWLAYSWCGGIGAQWQRVLAPVT